MSGDDVDDDEEEEVVSEPFERWRRRFQGLVESNGDERTGDAPERGTLRSASLLPVAGGWIPLPT